MRTPPGLDLDITPTNDVRVHVPASDYKFRTIRKNLDLWMKEAEGREVACCAGGDNEGDHSGREAEELLLFQTPVKNHINRSQSLEATSSASPSPGRTALHNALEKHCTRLSVMGDVSCCSTSDEENLQNSKEVEEQEQSVMVEKGETWREENGYGAVVGGVGSYSGPGAMTMSMSEHHVAAFLNGGYETAAKDTQGNRSKSDPSKEVEQTTTLQPMIQQGEYNCFKQNAKNEQHSSYSYNSYNVPPPPRAQPPPPAPPLQPPRPLLPPVLVQQLPPVVPPPMPRLTSDYQNAILSAASSSFHDKKNCEYNLRQLIQHSNMNLSRRTTTCTTAADEEGKVVGQEEKQKEKQLNTLSCDRGISGAGRNAEIRTRLVVPPRGPLPRVNGGGRNSTQYNQYDYDHDQNQYPPHGSEGYKIDNGGYNINMQEIHGAALKTFTYSSKAAPASAGTMTTNPPSASARQSNSDAETCWTSSRTSSEKYQEKVDAGNDHEVDSGENLICLAVRTLPTEVESAERMKHLIRERNFTKTTLCKYYIRGQCNKSAEECRYAHSAGELRPRPSLDKTSWCREILSTGRCSKGGSCKFAHSISELRATEGLKYTKLCKFFFAPVGSRCLNGEHCRFSHSLATTKQGS